MPNATYFVIVEFDREAEEYKRADGMVGRLKFPTEEMATRMLVYSDAYRVAQVDEIYSIL